MLHTTFKLLRENDACAKGYRKLAKSLGGVLQYGASTPIPLLRVLESNGLDDALWSLRAVLPEEEADRDRIARLFACRCVRETPLTDGRKVWDLLTDERSRAAVAAAEKYAVGEATTEELGAARAAAREAAWESAWESAREAAWESAWESAREAARESARAAARAAAREVARESARAAAREAARESAREVARESAREAQTEFFRQALAGRKEGP